MSTKGQKKLKAQPQGAEQIFGEIGDGLFQEVFGGKKFIACLIEFIKDARDWAANSISITIEPTKAGRILRIVDNGVGMNEKNRRAFASVNKTTAQGRNQTGQFGTGTKFTLYSYADWVRVITLPKDEDIVHKFGFSRAEYQHLVVNHLPIRTERFPRSVEHWPHKYKSGTEFIYQLSDDAVGVVAGKKLAQALSVRLPMMYRDILLVDGQSIPEKQIVGDHIQEQYHNQQLGAMIQIELYRPKTKSKDDVLRFSPGGEIGEITIQNFVDALGIDLVDGLPEVFLSDSISGTIAAEFLKDHAAQDRVAFKPSLGADPRTLLLLEFLQQIAPQVEERLRLRVGHSDTDTGRRAILDLVSLYNQAFNPEGEELGPVIHGDDFDGTEGDDTPGSDPSRPRQARPLKVKHFHEVEQGELFDLVPIISNEVRLSHGVTVDKINWHLGRSLAEEVRREPSKLVLRAGKQLGWGKVLAEIPNIATATVWYEVVEAREFRLNPNHLMLKRDQKATIAALNTDKLPGGEDSVLQWSLLGSGELIPHGKRAQYHATQSGTAVISCWDATDPSNKQTCEVTVTGPQRSEDIFKIGDYTFAILERTIHNKPVSMKVGSPYQLLLVNSSHPGFQAALKNGTLIEFLTLNSAIEFARFRRTHLEPGIDDDDTEEVLVEGNSIYAQLMTQRLGKS